MSSKTIVMIGMVLGSIIGGYIPELWGAGLLSYSSIITSAIGGLVGVWLAFKII